ncbi:hypothetical protein [Aureimonas sp. AU12]|uniref:hypothetical protein n=1 Tax=Aureimonas sp. AU12 TaxID=1638161 RepID=UPI0012E3E86B|nr:hypothetical protein [Aureimonas sp. AU12]
MLDARAGSHFKGDALPVAVQRDRRSVNERGRLDAALFLFSQWFGRQVPTPMAQPLGASTIII